MVVGADDDLVAAIIIERGGEGVDVMCFHWMGRIWLAKIMATDLAAVSIMALEFFTDREVELAQLDQACLELDRGMAVCPVDGFSCFHVIFIDFCQPTEILWCIRIAQIEHPAAGICRDPDVDMDPFLVRDRDSLFP